MLSSIDSNRFNPSLSATAQENLIFILILAGTWVNSEGQLSQLYCCQGIIQNTTYKIWK